MTDLERCSLRTSGGGSRSCRGFPDATARILSARSEARVSALASLDVDFAHGANGGAPPPGALLVLGQCGGGVGSRVAAVRAAERARCIGTGEVVFLS